MGLCSYSLDWRPSSDARFTTRGGFAPHRPSSTSCSFLYLDSQTTFKELFDRVTEGRLDQWEYRLLVHRCIDLLGRIDDPQRLSELATLLACVESGGRDISQYRPWASWALVSEIDGEGAVDALVQLFDHEDLNVRFTAIRSLAPFRDTANCALPALLGQLASDDQQIRTAVGFPLMFVQPNGQPGHFYPWGSRFMRSKTFPFSSSELSFCREVGACGTDVRRAIPLFLEGLRSPSRSVRATSVAALALFGENDDDICARIVDLRTDSDEHVRLTVLSATSLFPLNERVRATLDQAIDDPSESIRGAALKAIGLRGVACNDYLGRVRRILEDSEDGTTDLAAKTFVLISGDSEAAVAALLDSLRDPRLDQYEVRPANARRWQTLDTLAELGVESSTACQAIEPMLESTDPSLQSAAGYAFVMLGGDSVAGTRAMINADRADQADRKAGKNYSFSRMFSFARSGRMSTDVMIEMLLSEVPANRAFAARFLGEAGKHAAPALPALKNLLTDSDPNVVRWAEEAVQRIEYEVNE